MQVIIGNVVALISSLLMVYSGYVSKKKKILYVQTVQLCFSAASNLILGGITGGIIDVLGCIRNVLCYNGKLNNVAKFILIILSIAFTLLFNNMGIIGLLPLISTVTYICLMTTKDVIKFKYLIIFTMLLWMIYSIFIQSYGGVAFNAMTIITNIVAIVNLKKRGRKNERTI